MGYKNLEKCHICKSKDREGVSWGWGRSTIDVCDNCARALDNMTFNEQMNILYKAIKERDRE